MPNYLPAATAAVLTLAGLLLGDAGARRRALTGTVLVVLSLAALERALAVRGSADSGFLFVNGALLSAGVTLLVIAAVLALHAGERAGVLPLALLGLALATHQGLAGHLPVRGVLLGAGAGAIVHGALAFVPQAIPRHPGAAAGTPWWIGILLALVAVGAPHAIVMSLALVLILAWNRAWVRAALAVALLAPAMVLASAIAGPVGLGMSTLGEVPFSPYAATIVGGMLLLAAFVVAAVVPFGWHAGALFAPLGAALLVRVVNPALPEAVLHWRSLAAAWLVVAAVIAGVRGRIDAFLAASGLFVLVSGEGAVATAAGVVLTLLASAAVLARAPLARPVVLVSGVVTAGALALGLGATLEHEVVYSVLMAGTSIVLVARLPQWLAKTAVRPLASNDTTS